MRTRDWGQWEGHWNTELDVLGDSAKGWSCPWVKGRVFFPLKSHVWRDSTVSLVPDILCFLLVEKVSWQSETFSKLDCILWIRNQQIATLQKVVMKVLVSSSRKNLSIQDLVLVPWIFPARDNHCAVTAERARGGLGWRWVERSILQKGRRKHWEQMDTLIILIVGIVSLVIPTPKLIQLFNLITGLLNVKIAYRSYLFLY
jgi:hypothetical protein